MKKLLLSAALLSASFGFAQTELTLNGTFDEFTANTGDNADAWDMTPNQTVVDNTGTEIDSPFRAIWRNTALEDYLAATFSTTGSVNEQPGSSSNGANGTRGVRMAFTGSSNAILNTQTSTRRLYQRINNINAGEIHTFSIDSRSETAGNPTEVFILNEEITTEVGLENGIADTRVDGFMLITNDVNPNNNNGANFTTNTFNFTPTGDFVVIYVRATNAIDEDNDVFYDNVSLIVDPILSTNDFTINGEEVVAFPVPMTDVLTISGVEVDAATLYSLNGGIVATGTQTVDVAGLSNGAYILEINAEGKKATTMVVK